MKLELLLLFLWYIYLFCRSLLVSFKRLASASASASAIICFHKPLDLVLFDYIFKNPDANPVDRKKIVYRENGDDNIEGNLVLIEDIIVEILVKLPTKDLIKFKLVSKSWNKIISDVCIPQVNFRLSGFFLQLDYKIRKPWVFTSMSGEKRMLYDFLLPIKPAGHSLFDSCNGYLLFSHPNTFYLFNPITKECIVVRNCKLVKTRSPKVECVSFTFDDRGYYYIVFITPDPLGVYVFSSETRKWTVFGDLYLDSTVLHATWSKRLIFFSGYCYTLSFSGHMLKFGYKERGVTAIKLPEIVSDVKCIASFGVSQGLLLYGHHVADFNFMIWMLDESKENWVLKHSLCLQLLPAFSIPDLNATESLGIYGFHPTSDVVFIGHATRIFSYNHRDKTFKNIYTADPGTNISCGEFLVRPFVQNLLLSNSSH